VPRRGETIAEIGEQLAQGEIGELFRKIFRGARVRDDCTVDDLYELIDTLEALGIDHGLGEECDVIDCEYEED
jgi:hypothetical protein